MINRSTFSQVSLKVRLKFQQFVSRLKQWDWAYWAKWIGVNALGSAAAGWTLLLFDGFAQNLLWTLQKNIGRPVAAGLLGGLVGAIIGISQWLLLKKKLQKPGWWIIATAVGYAAFWATNWQINRFLSAALWGGVVSLLQWRLLRRQFRESYWWILASVTAWISGEFAAQWIRPALFASAGDRSYVVIMALKGLIYGLITGAALTLLLRQPLTLPPPLPRPFPLANLLRRSWGVWLKWIIMNTLFWAAAVWVVMFNQGILSDIFKLLNLKQTPTILGALFGAILGVGQFIGLHRRASGRWTWLFLTTFGGAVIWSVNLPFDRITENAIWGLMIGTLQWLILRRQFQGNLFWILASSAGWAAGEFTSQWVIRNNFLAGFSDFSGFIRLGIPGCVYGAITGAALSWLVQQPKPVGLSAWLARKTPPKVAAALQNTWVRWGLWSISCAVGWGIGYGAVGQTLSQIIHNAAVGFVGISLPIAVDKAIFEGVIGCCQLPALSRELRSTGGWVVVSCLGGAAGMLLWKWLTLDNALGIIVYGVVIGFFQWLILQQRFRGFWRWMLLRTVIWMICLPIVGIAGRQLESIDAGWAAGGFVYGAMTGVALEWLIRKRGLPYYPAQSSSI